MAGPVLAPDLPLTMRSMHPKKVTRVGSCHTLQLSRRNCKNGGPYRASLRTVVTGEQCAVTSRHRRAARAWQLSVACSTAPAQAVQHSIEQRSGLVSTKAGRQVYSASGSRFNIRERLWLSW